MEILEKSPTQLDKNVKYNDKIGAKSNLSCLFLKRRNSKSKTCGICGDVTVPCHLRKKEASIAPAAISVHIEIPHAAQNVRDQNSPKLLKRERVLILSKFSGNYFLISLYFTS